MELSKEEQETAILRLMYNSAAWRIHQSRLCELIEAETGAIDSITEKPVQEQDRDELNLHISRRQGLRMALALPEEVALDSDPEEQVSVDSPVGR